MARWGSLVLLRLMNRRGQTALEYFLLVLGVCVLVGDAVFSFGNAVNDSLKTATNLLN